MKSLDLFTLLKGISTQFSMGHITYFSLETGASGNKCSETYHGPEAFSEVETRNIRDYTLALDPVPVLAQCLHSYSQLFLWPFGYQNGGPYPENVEEVVRSLLTIFFCIHLRH